MELYTVSIQTIENGVLDYTIVDKVFSNKKDASKYATNHIRQQQSLWDNAPLSYFRKVKGYMSAIQLKHPTKDFVKIVSVQKVELEQA